jgi:hypothetical protein
VGTGIEIGCIVLGSEAVQYLPLDLDEWTLTRVEDGIKSEAFAFKTYG